MEDTFKRSTVNILMSLAFLVGCAVGYKVKDWRIRWLKRRRDILRRRLEETQKELHVLH